MSVPDIDALSDKQAIEALQFAVRHWIKRSGPEALLIWQRIEQAKDPNASLERWVIDPSADPGQAANASRKALKVFLERRQSEDLAVAAQKGVDAVLRPHAHVFDPASAAIVGLLAIGLVLAGRVKNINRDGVEFYQGLPPGLEKLLKILSAGLGAG
jgi:hypothetical protein